MLTETLLVLQDIPEESQCFFLVKLWVTRKLRRVLRRRLWIWLGAGRAEGGQEPGFQVTKEASASEDRRLAKTAQLLTCPGPAHHMAIWSISSFLALASPGLWWTCKKKNSLWRA